MRRLGWLFAAGLFFAVQQISPVQASYVVHFDPGGCVAHCARNEIDRVKQTQTQPGPIIVDGRCISACTLYLRRKDTCATPFAEFWFHQAWRRNWLGRKVPYMSTTRYMLSLYPPAIRAWIAHQGGLPFEGHIILKGAELNALVPACH